MKVHEYKILADENLSPPVVRALRARGYDVRTVGEAGFNGASDSAVLQLAVGERRVVWTHDGDFGKLAIPRGEAFVGVVYLRPGHLKADEVLVGLGAIEESNIDVSDRFILVVERRGDLVRLRLRQDVQL